MPQEGEPPIRLGSRSLEILLILAERAGELVGTDEIMARVWPNTLVGEATLRVHMSALRKVPGGIGKTTIALATADKLSPVYRSASRARRTPAFAAETLFRRSLDVARQQEALSWELRTATSLARLWRGQGRVREAYDLLMLVHARFTEGFGTADLVTAGALLEQLAA